MTRALDSVANEALGPRLKEEGFRRRGRTWRRRTGDETIQVVNVQGSMFSSGVEGRCALNTGIYFPRLAEVLGIGSLSDTPTEADCHLRRRAAMLRPDHHDAWFDFRADDPVSVGAAAVALRELYVDYGAAWLRQFSNFEAAGKELVRTGQLWWASAASLCSDNISDAAVLVRRAIDAAPRDIAPHLRRWGREHALL